MNKVITINLGGNAYQLEEGGYGTLRAYLETATARLKDNPDRDEILLDIERAIADKFRALLASHKNVVETKEVNAVIAEMGPIETDGGAAANETANPGGASESKAAGEEQAKSGSPRRLYRIKEGSMVSGVCNGLGAYLSVDPTFIRLAFAFLAIFWGTGFGIYIILALVIPMAETPEEKAAATGSPATAQEFIRRAKEGYYEATKGFSDSKTRREWTRRWKREMRAHSNQWRDNWENYWKIHTPVHPGLGFTLPVLSVLQGTATVLWICAMISLLATGMIFGLALPASVPVWAATLLLFILYGVIIGPMKAARRAYYWTAGGSRWAFPFIALVDTVVWMVVAVVLLCLAIHYFPELHQAVQTLPTRVDEAVTDVKTWWHNK
ncbi:MAG TPA: PspC domain-containing protein [Candidatus Acidoferrum sp.]|jgi:phage shock protein PspC (stress-responsive transcriptional regulator)|nr:PspC domain-containing protein [Candidatus Acidoferrum sp.]